MRKIVFAIITILSASVNIQARTNATVEVTGTATINVVPDRITVEIGMEEYFRHKADGDSVLVSMSEIEKDIRFLLSMENIPESAITVSDVGSYADRSKSRSLLMSKTLNVVLTDLSELDNLASKIGGEGVKNFMLCRIDNSDMDIYNRQGLKAALDAARSKAEFIAANEKLEIYGLIEIIENGPNYYESPSFSNVQMQYDGGSGMDSMRRIVRRYSVKVKYSASSK